MDPSKISTQRIDGAERFAEEPPIQIRLEKEISSDHYPIEESWLKLALVVSFFSAFLVPFLLLLYFLAPETGPTIDQLYLLADIHILLFLLFVTSTAAFVKLYQTLHWWSTYDFHFTPTGVEGWSVHSSMTSISGRPFLPYRELEQVEAKEHMFIERIFGYATVNFNEPPSREDHTTGALTRNRVTAPYCVIRGLRKKDAHRLVDEIHTYVMPQVTEARITAHHE